LVDFQELFFCVFFVEWKEPFLQNLSGGTEMALAILKKRLRQKRDRREEDTTTDKQEDRNRGV
jgi:hypothetical protein